MPNSSTLGKNIIKEWLDKQTDITKILDVGCGVGTYPRLLGDKYYWIGIEIWKPYVEEYHLKDLYKELFIGDAQTISLPYADCVILGDIVEHIDKVNALFFLEKVVKNYKHVVVSIPIGEYKQGPLESNPHEEHKSTWYFEDLLSILNPTLSKLEPNHEDSETGIGIFIK
jgi:SAM-dependent methyltransferase